MKNLFIILLLIFFTITACKKDDSSYTISGTFYLDCNTPLANASLEIFQHADYLSNNGTIGTAITDANGHFTFSYTAQSDVSSLFGISANLGGISPVNILDNLPPNQNVSDFKSYYKAKSTLIKKISITSPLTINDTLFLSGLTNFYVGPFINGTIIDSVSGNMDYSNNYKDLSSPFITIKFSWAVGRYNYIHNQNVLEFKYDRTCGAINVLTIPIN
jgi:hypothetical protein